MSDSLAYNIKDMRKARKLKKDKTSKDSHDSELNHVWQNSNGNQRLKGSNL